MPATSAHWNIILAGMRGIPAGTWLMLLKRRAIPLAAAH